MPQQFCRRRTAPVPILAEVRQRGVRFAARGRIVIGEVVAAAEFLRAYRTYLQGDPRKPANFWRFFSGMQGNADCNFVTRPQQIVGITIGAARVGVVWTFVLYRR